jgi:hypothetical protein
MEALKGIKQQITREQFVKVANLVIAIEKAVQKVIENQQHQHYLAIWFINAITKVRQKNCQNFVVGLKACPHG